LIGQRHNPSVYPSGKGPHTHFVGGWVGPKAIPDWSWKLHLYVDSNPQTVQLVTTFYIDYAVQTHKKKGSQIVYSRQSACKIIVHIYCDYLKFLMQCTTGELHLTPLCLLKLHTIIPHPYRAYKNLVFESLY